MRPRWVTRLRCGASSVFTASAGADYVRLLQPFDPTNSGREQLAAGQRASLEVLEHQIRLQAAECVPLWFLVAVRRLLCRRDAAQPDRHDRVSFPALRQPGRRCQLQRYPSAAAVGAHHVLAGRPAIRYHADEHALFHGIRAVQRAAEEHEREYAACNGATSRHPTCFWSGPTTICPTTCSRGRMCPGCSRCGIARSC